MAFSDLPAEIQLEIFAYLGPTDLKAVRAVCLKFRDNASPALFKRTVACARYKALGCLRDISRHPIYAGYVKEIVFDGSVYEPTLAANQATYQQIADRELPGM